MRLLARQFGLFVVAASQVAVSGCTGRSPSRATVASGSQAVSLDAVNVVDLTPKFLAFYDSATVRNANPDERWELWRRLYNFAAVPPGEYGRDMARRLLDSAWSRYPDALPRIRLGVAALGVSPQEIFRRVTETLGCGDGTKVELRVFVGGFEGNAFAFYTPTGTPAVAIPVEVGNPEFDMIHEFAHAAHRTGCSDYPAGYVQSLAQLVLSEGVAMRVTEQLLLNRPPTYHLSASEDWFGAATAQQAAILGGIRRHARETAAGTLQRFTFGPGTTGLNREAYFAGWVVTGALLQSGMTIHEIATTPASEVASLVERAIDQLLSAKRVQ